MRYSNMQGFRIELNKVKRCDACVSKGYCGLPATAWTEPLSVLHSRARSCWASSRDSHDKNTLLCQPLEILCVILNTANSVRGVHVPGHSTSTSDDVETARWINRIVGAS